MKAEMFLMEEPCGQSNHLILIGLSYMVDPVNVLSSVLTRGAQPGLSSLHRLSSDEVQERSWQTASGMDRSAGKRAPGRV